MSDLLVGLLVVLILTVILIVILIVRRRSETPIIRKCEQERIPILKEQMPEKPLPKEQIPDIDFDTCESCGMPRSEHGNVYHQFVSFRFR